MAEEEEEEEEGGPCCKEMQEFMPGRRYFGGVVPPPRGNGILNGAGADFLPQPGTATHAAASLRARAYKHCGLEERDSYATWDAVAATAAGAGAATVGGGRGLAQAEPRFEVGEEESNTIRVVHLERDGDEFNGGVVRDQVLRHRPRAVTCCLLPTYCLLRPFLL